MEYQDEIDNFLTEYRFSCTMLKTDIMFLFVLSSTLVLCKRLHLFNFRHMIFKKDFCIKKNLACEILRLRRVAFATYFITSAVRKLPPDFSDGSLCTFIPYTILIQHAVFDHIVVTQQFFYYSAFHYAEQRLLQCI